MGRKKIAKEPKNTKGKAKEKVQESDKEEEEIVPEPTPVKKSGKAAKGGKSLPVSSDLNIFSDSFKNRISEFANFYKEFLERKAQGGDMDLEEELEKVTNKVSEKIEVACSKVIRAELSDTQKWIKDQQKTIKEQIEKVSKAYDETKNTLSSTKTFNETEITQQLKPISLKREELQESHEKYGDFLKRSEDIYNVDGMDIQ